MLKIFRIATNNTSPCISRYFSESCVHRQVAKPLLRPQAKKKKIGTVGWLLLIVPASTFALGTWQVQRKKWKESLIYQLKTLTNSDPVILPTNKEEIEKLEYRPVHVRGHFLHDKELYMGPRSCLVKGDASTSSRLVSGGQNNTQGYLVVTPFKLADRDETILVNRGWVPSKNKQPSTRKNGQVEGEVDVIGIVRLNESRPTFTPKNSTDSNNWFYRDIEKMAAITGASPIFLDATDEFDVPEGPVGGQTRISLRNEHMSYILTWYSLCAATSYMWYRQFIRPVI